MKKIIFALIALMMLGSLLVADQVIKTKEGEKESILSGYAEVFDNNTNTWYPDSGIEITSITFRKNNGAVIGRLLSGYYPITDTFGYFNCPKISSHVNWYSYSDDEGHTQYFNFNDVDYIDFTYRGTKFDAQMNDTVHLKFIQGY